MAEIITKKGYTLVEILVAVTMFVIIIAVPTGFFVSAIRGQRIALAEQSLIDNISYTLDYISRALRMAKKNDGSCSGWPTGSNYSISAGGNGILFLDSEGNCQEFYLDPGDKRIKKSSLGPLTSQNLEILSFKITGQGWDEIDNVQPRVTLFLEIRAKEPVAGVQPKIKIQTTISQRNLDLK